MNEPLASPQGINQKKIILSTTEVSKLLLSQGRRKIDDSFLSHNEKKNNIDITEIASQINIKLSKGDENLTGLGLADQSMFKGVLEKSNLFKPTKTLDKSGIANNADKFPKESILSKLDKSQAGNGLAGIIEPVVIPEAKPRKKILKIDGNEIFANNGQIKLPYIINNYFPYENDNNNNNIADPDNANRLKNFLVIFYFKIEKTTFVLIRKIDKKFVPIYFWNKEEDARRFGIKYSQISTPGLYFKTFENFTNAFKEKIDNRLETIELRKNLNAYKEKCSLYEQTIENLKKEHEQNMEEVINENNNLKSKIIEMESIEQLKDTKIKTLSKNIDELNEEIKKLKNSKTILTKKVNDYSDNINELKIINDKLKKENKELQKNIIEINERIKTNNSNIKNRKSLMSINNINNKNSESENEEEEELSDQNKNKFNYNMRNPKKSKTKNFNNFNIGQKMNFNNLDILSEKNNYQRTDNPINSMENEQFEFTSDENSVPKLDDYNIENDEEDKINEVRNIDEIQTFLTGKNKNKNKSRKSLKKEDSYSNNSNTNNNNNVIVYISDNSNNKKNRNRSKSRSRSISKSKNNSKDKDINKKNLNKINEEEIDSKDQEILILKNKIENLNLEIQNKSHIIEELKYLIDSKSNNNSSNIEGIKMESSFINKNDISSNN